MSELEDGEHFIFNGDEWKRCKRLPRHDSVDCMELKTMRHRPFGPMAEVEPCQHRMIFKEGKAHD